MLKASLKCEGKVAVLGVLKTFWLKEPVVVVAFGEGKFQSTVLIARSASALMGSDIAQVVVSHPL